MLQPLLTNDQPSQTLPRFNESVPVDQALGGAATGTSLPVQSNLTPGGGPLAEDSPETNIDKQGAATTENANGQRAPEMTAEMVNIYQTFVSNGMKLVHSPETRDRILEHLKATQPPEKALGDVTLMIVKRLEDEFQRQQKQLPGIVILDGSNEIMGNVVEVAETSGLYELDEQTKAKAYSYAVQEYIKEGLATGKLDPLEVKRAAARLSERQAQVDPEGAKLTATVAEKMPAAPQGPAPQQPAPQGLIGGA